MNLLHKIVVAVLAVICFMGMAVQGAPHGGCNTCGYGGGGYGGGGNNARQTGGAIGGLNILAAQG